uniref:Similar to n=1 Tax=Caenorhabditis tropicalis TaxID=1561998 RepID=A0A1I7V3C2_9PELO
MLSRRRGRPAGHPYLPRPWWMSHRPSPRTPLQDGTEQPGMYSYNYAPPAPPRPQPSRYWKFLTEMTSNAIRVEVHTLIEAENHRLVQKECDQVNRDKETWREVQNGWEAKVKAANKKAEGPREKAAKINVKKEKIEKNFARRKDFEEQKKWDEDIDIDFIGVAFRRIEGVDTSKYIFDPFLPSNYQFVKEIPQTPRDLYQATGKSVKWEELTARHKRFWGSRLTRLGALQRGDQKMGIIDVVSEKELEKLQKIMEEIEEEEVIAEAVEKMVI